MKDELTITFDGYLAEQIRLAAEKVGKTPEEYILSLFGVGCNAPSKAK